MILHVLCFNMASYDAAKGIRVPSLHFEPIVITGGNEWEGTFEVSSIVFYY